MIALIQANLAGKSPRFCMTPIAGKPLLQWQIESLARSGARFILVVCSKEASDIQDTFGDGSKFGLKISYVFEERSSGTGGAMYYAAKTFKEAAAGYKAASFALNPPGFVRATEFPFLTSYKKGRMVRICGQLDLADATWDGCATRLAQGNGEVKELLSILRCETFSGWVCLGGGAAYPGSLSDAANDLARLLENM